MPDPEPEGIENPSTQVLIELVVNSSTDYGVIVTNPSGVIVVWNPAAESLLGWSAEEAMGTHYSLYFTSDNWSAQGRHESKGWQLKRDGSFFWAGSELTALHKGEALLGYSRIIRDRTDEWLAGERLRLAQQAGNIGTFEWLPALDQFEVSAEFCRLWRLPVQASFSIARLEELIHPEDKERFVTAVRALANHTRMYLESRIACADNDQERWLAWRGAFVQDQASRTCYVGVCYDITELKQAAVAARKLQVRSRDLVDGMQEGFYQVEAVRDESGQIHDFRYLQANPAFWQNTGLPITTEVIGHTIREIIPGAYEELIQAHIDLLEKTRLSPFEIRIAALGQRWFEARAQRVAEDCLAVLFMDITQRKLTEEALAESEARLKAITNSIEHIIWGARPDGYADYFNERWYDYTGMTSDQAQGHRWLDLLHPDDKGRIWKIWQHSLATGAAIRCEFRLKHRSGQYHWFLSRAQALYNNGEITRWFVSLTDIQTIVEAREILTRSQEELEWQVANRTRERDRMWHLSNDMMAVIRLDGGLVAVNEACTRILGWTEEEFVGTNYLTLLHPDDIAKTTLKMANLEKDQHQTGFEMRLRHKNGSYRLTSWTSVPEQGFVYTVGRDITEQRQLAEQLHQAQKMEAVGKLTGGIAHDFNNLLTGVIGSLDLMQKHLEAGRTSRLERYMGAATTSAQRAAALTQRLLIFSRQQTLDLKAVDLNQLVASLEDLLHQAAGPSIALLTTLETGLCLVWTDRNQLENVLINLVINARDAMPSGGSITIITSRLQLNSLTQETGDLKEGEYIVLCVTDTGVGIPADIIDKVFEPFFTTKPIGQGTGLGLSMVYGYVKQTKGHIRILSEPG
ncbi:PAS domain S-box-containing protein, partial [Pseudomonas duriflava]